MFVAVVVVVASASRELLSLALYVHGARAQEVSVAFKLGRDMFGEDRNTADARSIDGPGGVVRCIVRKKLDTRTNIHRSNRPPFGKIDALIRLHFGVRKRSQVPERPGSIVIGGRLIECINDQLHCSISVFAIDLLHEPCVFVCAGGKNSRPLIRRNVIPGQD